VYVWFKPDEQLNVGRCGAVSIGDFATSLAATGFDYLDGSSAGVPAVNAIPEARLKAVAAQFSTLVVVSPTNSNADDLQRRLAGIGVTVRRQPVHIEAGDFRLDVTLLRPAS
jgi:hypothetical protein